MKHENPWMKLKDIAIQLRVDYGYARNVYSKYVRDQVTAKGSALSPSGPQLPFVIQGWHFWNAVPASWYEAAPVEPSNNRNMQKRFQGSSFSVIIHKTGSTFIHPLFGGRGWKEDFERWLGTWRSPDEVRVFMDSLQEVGKKEYAFAAPGVPKNYKVTIRGVGSFHTDTTPYPDGTVEYSFDPGFQRTVTEAKEVANLALSVASEATKSLGSTNEALGKFARQLELHYQVLGSMRNTLKTMSTPWLLRVLRSKLGGGEKAEEKGNTEA